MKTQPAIACLAFLLTACADMTWQKPGAPGDAGNDLQECHQRAVLASRRLGLTTSVTQNPDLVTEQGLMAECMRAKGYRLEKP